MSYIGEKGYINLLKELVEKAETKGFRNVRDGHKRCSLFGKQLRFDLSEGFPLFTHKQVFLRGTFEEMMWFLRGQTDNQILKDKNVHIWDLWESVVDENNPTELGAIYGKSWRNFGHVAGEYVFTNRDSVDVYEDAVEGFDQIEWLINEVKTNPTSSSLFFSAWNPQVHCKREDKLAALPPCHVSSQLFVEDGKLSLQLYQRSSDFIVGGSFNVAGYALLTHLIAQQCNLDVGEFIWSLGDVHLYSDQLDMAKEILSRPTHPLPSISIKKAKDLYSYEWSDIEILNYKHEPKIKIPVAK